MMATTLSIKTISVFEVEINTEAKGRRILKGRCSGTTVTSLVITFMSVATIAIHKRKARKVMKHT